VLAIIMAFYLLQAASGRPLLGLCATASAFLYVLDAAKVQKVAGPGDLLSAMRPG